MTVLLFDVAQAAEALGFSVDYVYRQCNSGAWPHRRIGNGRGVIRFAQADLDRIVAAAAVEPTPRRLRLTGT